MGSDTSCPKATRSAFRSRAYSTASLGGGEATLSVRYERLFEVDEVAYGRRCTCADAHEGGGTMNRMCTPPRAGRALVVNVEA